MDEFWVLLGVRIVPGIFWNGCIGGSRNPILLIPLCLKQWTSQTSGKFLRKPNSFGHSVFGSLPRDFWHILLGSSENGRHLKHRKPYRYQDGRLLRDPKQLCFMNEKVSKTWLYITNFSVVPPISPVFKMLLHLELFSAKSANSNIFTITFLSVTEIIF